MIATSTLTGSVFNQTGLPFTFENAWWVERRLQFMRINGLVKMIENSKVKSPLYIDGYLPKYKWSYRPESERLNIDECLWIYDLLQVTQKSFGWDCWSDLVQIKDFMLFKEAILTAIKFGAGTSYAIQVYKSKMQDAENRMQEMQAHLIRGEQFEPLSRTISTESARSWQAIREMI